MGKSQESFNKKEKEKKRLKKRKEKRERREQRKVERDETGPVAFEDLIRYVDENGNLTKEKPDPLKMRVEIKLEDIVIGATSRSEEDLDPIRIGRVKFFNDEKGYGFITDLETKESVFVHINNLAEPIKENDKVQFEVEMGPKGPNAVRVKMAPKAPPKPKIEKDKDGNPVAKAETKTVAEGDTKPEAKVETKVETKPEAKDTPPGS